MSIFKNEGTYLVHLIDCSINGKQPCEKPDRLSFETIFALGKFHCVANIAYPSVLKLNIKPDIKLLNQWENNYYSYIKRSLHQESFRNELLKCFKKNGIEVIELKGTVLRNLYPQPEFRFMTDLDFIVKPEKLDLAGAVLTEMGCALKKREPFELVYDSTNRYDVELHSDYFVPDSKYAAIINNPFSKAEKIDDGICYTVGNDNFYLYNLLHFLKHLEGGNGIRKILDLYLIEKHFAGITDTDYIENCLVSSGELQVMKRYINLSKVWFGGEASNQDFSKEIQLVLTSGLHGTTKNMLAQKAQKDKQSGKKFIRTRRLFSLIFQPKETIYAEYPVCRKRNYPVVVCWAYRIGSTLKNKEKRKRIRLWANQIKNTKK